MKVTRHVLAAAVRAGRGAIVTWNKAHFPSEACRPFNIEIQDPDEFLSDLWWAGPEAMARVLTLQAAHLVNPPQTVPQVLDTLRRSVPQFAATAGSSGLL
jgi:hypothetical protein